MSHSLCNARGAPQPSSPPTHLGQDRAPCGDYRKGSTEMDDGLHLPAPALFAGLSPDVACRWAQYFYTRPKNPAKSASLRPHMFAPYNPFAKRSQFPAGIRFCVNVYTGCEHACGYCYGRNYIPDPTKPREKKNFFQGAKDDLVELLALDLPPAPLHISNSTDAFQEVLEKKHRQALQIMGLVAANRHHFTTVTFLTKNPLLISQPDYVALLDSLKPCQVEVSLAFADERGRQLYEPCAPNIGSRLEGIRRLREAGISVSLRIDPLFPREPLHMEFWPTPRLADYGIEHTHTLDEIERLIQFASETGCQKIIVSALKVPVGRWACPDFKEAFRALYGAPWGGRPKTRSFAWRLPESYIGEHLIGEVRQVASHYDVGVTTCWENLVNTK